LLSCLHHCTHEFGYPHFHIFILELSYSVCICILYYIFYFTLVTVIDVIALYSENIPRCLKTVIKNKGFSTKY
uniref:Uncharacterized protein n=1 Tax=Astyanax mexicanus TaxID=7994 RepID=A0A3B1K1C9_ASTMX